MLQIYFLVFNNYFKNYCKSKISSFISPFPKVKNRLNKLQHSLKLNIGALLSIKKNHHYKINIHSSFHSEFKNQ